MATRKKANPDKILIAVDKVNPPELLQPTQQELAAEYINANYPRSRVDVAGKLDAILMELVIGRRYR